MRSVISIIILFVANLDYTVAQTNLVPNGSFEVYSSCPTGAAQINNAVPWVSPTIATPDYFNACNISGVGVPSNNGGWQIAQLGVAYTGIGTFVAASPNFRDYIQVSLSDTLITDKKYYVSFYASPADNYFYSTNTIGLLLTDTAVSSGTSQVLPFFPQVENNISNNLNDTALWYLISDTIIASGGERYVTIGNFQTFANSGIDTINYSSSYGAAYYYIDNVSITDITVGINEVDGFNNIFNIYPNPGDGSLHIDYFTDNGNATELFIYDIHGRRLLCYNLIAGENSFINHTGLKNGVYFYSICVNSNIVKNGKLIITK